MDNAPSKMGRGPLLDLPIELYECIIQDLNLRNLCMLRLVNREVAQKTTLRIFRSLIKHARVNLTKDSLESTARAPLDSLGTYIDDLTIVGVVCSLHRLEYMQIDRHKITIDGFQRTSLD
jgi:hypothetical protein